MIRRRCLPAFILPAFRVPALLLAAAGMACCGGLTARAIAQPAPSFQARCGDLRKSVAALELKEGALTVIDVVGALTDVKSDGSLVYLSMCGAPDPKVICITYSTSGRRIGDTVVVSGAIHQAGTELIALDPCLHHPPK